MTNASKCWHQTVAVDFEGEPTDEVKRNGKGNTCEIMRCALLYINILIPCHAMTCNYFSSQLFNGQETAPAVASLFDKMHLLGHAQLGSSVFAPDLV